MVKKELNAAAYKPKAVILLKYEKYVEDELDIVQNDKSCDLYLDDKTLICVPERIIEEHSCFTHLKRIHLGHNKLTYLPNEICNLPELLELDLQSNILEELPKRIGCLGYLETLDVRSNNLTELPSSVGSLLLLSSLKVSDNNLEALPSEICSLTSLRELSAMNNKIEDLPQHINLCTSLTRLLLDRNCLKWLPSSICELPNLEELSVCKNNLLCLPLNLGVGSSLKRVYVDDNAFLHALPFSMSLMEIGFHNCGLYNFEEDVTSLQYVTVEGSELGDPKKIYLPREIQFLTTEEDQGSSVPSLLELTLRSVHRYHKYDPVYPPSCLPPVLRNTLSSPSAHCVFCERPVFFTGYPVVFESQIHLYRLLRLSICCSSRCVYLSAFKTLLPVVYPAPKPMVMQVALVEQ